MRSYTRTYKLNNIKSSVRDNSRFLWPKDSKRLSCTKYQRTMFGLHYDWMKLACKSSVVQYETTLIIQLFKSSSTPLTNNAYYKNLLLILVHHLSHAKFHPLLYVMFKNHVLRIPHHYTFKCHYGDSRYSAVSQEYLGVMHASFKDV